MSKKLFFGSNLKMYKNIKDTVSYLQELESLTKDISRDEIELFIIPSYTTLDSASKAIDQKNIRLGAQNMCWEEQGQFTGEISPLMLGKIGVLGEICAGISSMISLTRLEEAIARTAVLKIVDTMLNENNTCVI